VLAISNCGNSVLASSSTNTSKKEEKEENDDVEMKAEGGT